MFFGKALGLITNYSPDSALRCSLDGEPLEALHEAYRPGEVRLSYGGPTLSPTTISRVLEQHPIRLDHRHRSRRQRDSCGTHPA